MSKKAYEETNISAIGQAIVDLTGATGYTVAQMADAISDNLALKPTGSINISVNGTYDVTNKSSAVVNVSGGSAVLGTKSISANGTYQASSDSLDGYSEVTVNVPNPSTGSINISANGTYDVTDKASAVVNVSGTPTLQSKTATENGTVTPDVGYDGLSSVIVNVSGGGSIPTGMYVGEFTLAEDKTTYDVSANFSAAPKTIIVQYADGQTMPSANATLSNYQIWNVTIGSTRWTSSTQTAATNNSATISNVSATGFTCGTANNTYPLRTGRYVWVAIV